MNFSELAEHFEKQFSEYELLELHYTPYHFGSGYKVYRIKGLVVKFVYDGRDRQVEIFRSALHDKYPICQWQAIFEGSVEKLLKAQIADRLCQ